MPGSPMRPGPGAEVPDPPPPPPPPVSGPDGGWYTDVPVRLVVCQCTNKHFLDVDQKCFNFSLASHVSLLFIHFVTNKCLIEHEGF